MADIHERNTLSSNVEKLSDEEDVDTVSIITYNRQPGDESCLSPTRLFLAKPLAGLVVQYHQIRSI